MMRYALLTSNAMTLVNFRGHLIKKILSEGGEVFAIASDFDEATRLMILSLGAVPVNCYFNRTGMNPFVDFFSTLRLTILLRSLKLDSILTYSIKPVIFGGFAAFLARIPVRVAMVEGLGFAYTENGAGFSFKKVALKFLTNILYKISLRFQDKVIFLNQDDINEFLKLRLVTQSKVIKLGAIGVDLNEWVQQKVFTHPITFTIVARLLREKGVFEFIEAAKIIKKDYPEVRFLILGDVDLNPSSLSRSQVLEWVNEGIVDWPGHVEVREWLCKTSVFVLPSYREGFPRSTQEAMAMGLAVITTDVPGCRDTVIDGLNGFLVEVRNSKALADAMIKLIKDPSLIEFMGEQSRLIATQRFDVNKANATIFKAIRQNSKV